jgi:hypothetical protein
MGQKKKTFSREVVVGDGAEAAGAGVLSAGGGLARRGSRVGRRELTVGIVTAVAVAGVVAGAVVTRLLLRARADRRWDEQVERFREQGAM